MGNRASCFSPQEVTTFSSRRNRSTKDKERLNRKDDLLLQQQALATALLFKKHQHQTRNNKSPSFNRSTSVVYTKKQQIQGLRRSTSHRDRLDSDTTDRLQPYQLVSQDPKTDDLETNHFILVHGGGFGAWCWYKTITLLQDGGFKVDAVDLTGCGIHSFKTNSITSLSQYVKPLTDILEKLEDGKKVILVGHDFGGTCISYAMELFPSKISKAIFVSAAMLANEQSTLDLFSQQIDSNDLIREAQIVMYANGNDQPPTAIDFNKELIKDFLFNKSPAKDVALASLSMKPTPFAPIKEKLFLSDKKYGSVRRFYIVTPDDHAITISQQETMISLNPPEQVFRVKGSDHSPFLSRPQGLHKILVDISHIPPK